MKIGIFAKTFAGTDADTVLAAVRGAGYAATQFNMACVGLPSMPDIIPVETAAGIARAAEANGVTLSAMSGTFNMIHPDLAVRVRGLAQLQTIAASCASIGLRLVTLCTGSRDAQDQWRHHPDNDGKDAWRDLTKSMATAIAIADQYDVALGIEPEMANVVSSAAKARQLIDEMGSKRLKIVLDPANLFEVAEAAARRDIFAKAIDTLAGDLAMAHAKDRYADGSFATAGTGVVDFPFFLGRLKAAGFEGPLITHGLSAEEAPGVARFLNGVLTAL